MMTLNTVIRPSVGADLSRTRFIALCRFIGPHTHHPRPGSQAGGRTIRRGEGGGVDVEWAFMVARGCGWDRLPPRGEPGEQDTGDPKGPPIRPSSTLAPTDVGGPLLIQ
jgi:hypothetical protein